MPNLTDAQFNTLKGLYAPIHTELSKYKITAPGTTELNTFVNSLINMYYQEPTMTSFVDKREFWNNWDETMPENLAQALLMITVPTDTFQFDINQFIPKSHRRVETFEQNYVTSYRRSAGASLEIPILAAAFNSPQKFQGYLNRYRESNENALYRFKYFNLLYQLMFPDRAVKGSRVLKTGTAAINYDYSDLIVPNSLSSGGVPQYLNPIVKKIIDFISDKAGNFNNDAFINLMQNFNNLKIPNQVNYNLGDKNTLAIDPTTVTEYDFGVPWCDTGSDYILFAPQSVITKYLGSTNNALGIAQVFNKRAVDVGVHFKRIEVYDDISPKTTMRQVSDDGTLSLNIVDNPFYNPPLVTAAGKPQTATLADGTKSPLYYYKHRFGIFDRRAMLIKTRFLTPMSQDWATNMANTTYLHTWFNVGICPFAQGFIYELTKSS